MIQLPNDAVAVGYTLTRPFQYEQVFRSQTAGFTGTEREFVEAGYGYRYVQLDQFMRVVLK